jgi:hypothetical protein
MKEHAEGKRQGQGLVEIAFALPVLLILLIGVVEMGFALRSYLVVVNAAREGARFASRARYSDQYVGERIVSSGGVQGTDPVGNPTPFLCTTGEGRNTGIIVTHIPMTSSGGIDLSEITIWLTGVIAITDIRPICEDDSMVSLAEISARHAEATGDISTARAAAELPPGDNHIVVVEVFFAHYPLWNIPLVPLPSPWLMRASAEMRVMTDLGR